MMVPLGARQHARVGCEACWSTQMSETKNSQEEGRPAAPGTEVVHLVLEVCSVGLRKVVLPLEPSQSRLQLSPVRARTALHFPAAHPFPESLTSSAQPQSHRSVTGVRAG